MAFLDFPRGFFKLYYNLPKWFSLINFSGFRAQKNGRCRGNFPLGLFDPRAGRCRSTRRAPKSFSFLFVFSNGVLLVFESLLGSGGVYCFSEGDNLIRGPDRLRPGQRRGLTAVGCRV